MNTPEYLSAIAQEFRAALPSQDGLVLAEMIEQGVTALESHIRYAFSPVAAPIAPGAVLRQALEALEQADAHFCHNDIRSTRIVAAMAAIRAELEGKGSEHG